MKYKNLLALAVFIVLTLSVYNQDAYAHFMTVRISFLDKPIVKGLTTFYPDIESILYNPSVYKKQVSRNLIQAVGQKQTGQKYFIIHFRKEQLHGEWQSFYSNNQRCDSGRFDKSLPDGEWKTWFPNGRLKTIRTYGAEKFRYIKADLRRNHPKDKRFAITRYAGRKSARHFHPQFGSNTGIDLHLSILKKIQNNTEDEGSAYHAPYTTCLHHGVYINYYENGDIKDSGNYVNGLRHGLWKESINPDHMYAVGFYLHGVRNSQWKYYTKDDNLVYTEFYKLSGTIREWHYFKR